MHTPHSVSLSVFPYVHFDGNNVPLTLWVHAGAKLLIAVFALLLRTIRRWFSWKKGLIYSPIALVGFVNDCGSSCGLSDMNLVVWTFQSLLSYLGDGLTNALEEERDGGMSSSDGRGDSIDVLDEAAARERRVI